MAIDLRSQEQQTGEDPADNIIKIINAAAQAKQSKLKLEQELMLDDIKRQRDLKYKGLEEQQTQRNETAGFESMFGGGQPQQPTNAWQATQPQYNEATPPPMSMPDGSVSGSVAPVQQPEQQPQAQESQPVMYNGIRLPSAMEIAQGKRAAGEKVNGTKLRMYNETWQKAKQGLASEGELKMLADLAEVPEFDNTKLTNDLKIQGRTLATKLYGMRGAENGLPSIYKELESGKTIEQIEDSLRFSGQSAEMAGDFRNAAQSILINSPEAVSQKSLDYIDDFLGKGDITGAKEQLKRLARKESGVEEARAVSGKERTVKLLDEIQNDLNALEQKGINTNIFTGTAEEIARKVGAVREPEARQVATKIMAAIQNYRRSMSGVAFSVPESEEYKTMFPSIGRTSNFNTANINALKDVFSGDLDNFYSLSMGDKQYNSLFKSQNNSPAVGHEEDGYQFKGGDPSDQNNWIKK